jgi:DNA-directed RNA polymerase, beta subunit/140 kD subunit
LKAKEVSENNRLTFSHIEELLEVPDLLSIQTRAYQQFLQEFEAPEARDDFGLQGVLNSVFPIEDLHRNYILEFNNYYLKQPKIYS